MKTLKLIAAAALCLSAWVSSDACSRVVYQGDKGYILIGRTLDWKSPIPTNIYIYPQGIEKTSMPQEPCLKWTSKYGSVIAVGYDGGVTEGMNEMGLCMNGLFCKGSVYKEYTVDGSLRGMSLAMMVSFFLDNFASVGAVDTWLKNNDFGIYGKTFDGGTVSLLHWALTDKTGDTLIMEYDGGKLNTYRGKQYKVLTNDPQVPKMEAIEAYWEGIGGANMLPGTVKSPDRFVRASFFISHVPADFDYPDALGCIESIMGTVSVPYGYLIEGEPNVSSTQWRSVCDITGGKYYFKFAYSTGDFWFDLSRVSLRPGAPILKFDTSKDPYFTGDAIPHMTQSQGFTPMW